MSKLRKLQQEIDLTLRKINEGVNDWTKLFTKLQNTKDESKCEKLVAELKRDLKRLQRHREQVRAWIASGELKEFGHLQEARRSVEELMETFYIWERDNKVKAFSAAGLSREDQDPATKAKLRCAEWLRDAENQLETSAETLEADLEALGSASTKAGKATKEKQRATLLHHINRHQEYITKIERVLRLLLNDQVTVDEVEYALKDSLEYYIESFADADYVEDEGMWDMLPLDAVDEGIGKISSHIREAASSSGLLSVEEQSKESVGMEEVSGKEDDDEGSLASSTDGKKHKKKLRGRETSDISGSADVDVTVPSPLMSVTPAQLTKEREKIVHVTPSGEDAREVTTPSSRRATDTGQSSDFAAVLSGAGSGQQGDVVRRVSGGKLPLSPRSPSLKGISSAVFATPPPPPPPPRPSSSVPAVAAGVGTPSLGKMIVRDTPSPSGEDALVSAIVRTESSSEDVLPVRDEESFQGIAEGIQRKKSENEPVHASLVVSERLPPEKESSSSNGGMPWTSGWPQWHLGTWIQEAEDQERPQSLQLHEDVDGREFLGRKEEKSPFEKDLRWKASLLDLLASNIPSLDDSQWHLDQHTIMCPRGSWSPSYPATTPLSFPNQIHPTLCRESTFRRLSVETAFLAFYYQQHCMQQLYAIEILQSHGWRYHTEYKTWFARYGAPIEQHAEYEKGSLKFWDATGGMINNGVIIGGGGFSVATAMDSSIGGGSVGGGGWCVRRTPPNFIFEYSKMAS